MTVTSAPTHPTASEAVPQVQAPSSHRLSARIRRRMMLSLLRLALIAALVGGWEAGVRTRNIDPFFWGQPSGVYHQLATWVSQGTAQGALAEQISYTLQEAVLGFLIGVALGVVCGIGLGRNRFLSDLLAPFIKVANSIPRIILGSIFTVAFGFGMQSKVLLAVVLVFFGVFFNAFQGTREVDRNLMSNARILGASRWKVTRHVVLPSAFTWILASLHVSFGFALVGAIVGEFLGAREGMGLLIATAQGSFDSNGVFAAMIVIAVVALIAEWLLTMIEDRLLTWRPETTVNE